MRNWIAAAVAVCGTLAAAPKDDRWVATWAASQQLCEQKNLPPAPGLDGNGLKQVVHASIGGKRLRVRFSNEFGTTPLGIASAQIAVPQGTGKALAFHGQPSVVVPPGAPMLSDPIDFDLAPLSDVEVTIRFNAVPKEVTAHPGSRATSFILVGESVAAKTEHWYFLSAVEVTAGKREAAVATLGDSITDGRGSTTDKNDRWTDNLARRLHAAKRTAFVAVLNQGLGGNRLLKDGLGSNVLARLDRDVLARPGVRWLIVLEGINDLGSGEKAPQIIAAYEQIIDRAHAAGLRVYGATILPCGESFYFKPELEANRQQINAWIRTSGRFDAVIDFDAATRDPQKPAQLRADADSGDHLHPSSAGYRIMADAISLKLFEE